LNPRIEFLGHVGHVFVVCFPTFRLDSDEVFQCDLVFIVLVELLERFFIVAQLETGREVELLLLLLELSQRNAHAAVRVDPQEVLLRVELGFDLEVHVLEFGLV